jgi:D-serine deaminase-like pyridoxal phosphate-dependent protein
VVLFDRLERNLESMAAFAARAGVALRPHAKTHKCVEIARRQIGLGARGLSVATVGEAEILTARTRELTDVFIAYPLWPADDLLPRLRALTDQARVSVGADSAAGLERLAPLAGRIAVSIEVDCGLGRTGVSPGSAGTLANRAADLGLEVGGVFTFPGHSYRPNGAEAAAGDESAALGVAADTMSRAGFRHFERSGGSTPTARLTAPGTLTELRPGVYAFNDAQQVELGTATMDEVALVVAATVVSRPQSGQVVLDAGSKVLGPDRPAWATGHGRLPDWPDARITGLWEHHAVVACNGPGPDLGAVVAVIPNHVCTAVNLVPELVVVETGRIVARWPVAARAANR